MIYVKGLPLNNEIMDTKQYLRLERVSENGIIVCSRGGARGLIIASPVLCTVSVTWNFSDH